MKILVFVIILIINRSIIAEKSGDVTEEFIPTNEWQVVKEGQKLPPGLHVRINLETGLREAKLLDHEERQSTSNDIIPISSETSPEEISRRNLEEAFAKLDLSKDDVAVDETHADEIRKRFRPYEELKKDFESINMKIQTDQEIVTNLIQQLNQTDNNEDRKSILTDLEYYLHQYDNAILFSDLNGLDLLLHLLNSTNTTLEMRGLVYLVLGAAFQGNPKVQSKALQSGFIQYLLRLLNTEADDTISLRILFTLSTLLRGFPQAQRNFLEHGGAESMVTLLDSTNANNKLAVRALTLMHDLIVEKDQAVDNKKEAYRDIHILNQLVDYGWCTKISARLASFDIDNFDYIEKTIHAMIRLIDTCHTDFAHLIPTLNKFQKIFSKANINEDAVYTDLLNNTNILLTKLRQRSSYDL